MIRIAICDDNNNSIQSCKEIITSMNINDLDMIDSYESGEVFLNEVLVKNVQYDIVILDIDMPGMNGFEVAKKLNEREIDMLIMFYTAHEQYVYKAYEYQPFRYIRKEFAREELPFALKQAIVLLKNKKRKNVNIKLKDSNMIINSDNIICFEANGKHCDIFLKDERIIKTIESFNKLLLQVENTDFFVVHRGIAVNLKFVDRYTNQSVWMKNGMEVYLSRRNIRNFKMEMIRCLRCEL
ncbi:MAG: LytTR family DNA-binding domain-containing protein [Oscillospiraceae bacterium]|nr:LytTR family DNA-binding domain-containing protein [Oscillospiraceae bacterium]